MFGALLRVTNQLLNPIRQEIVQTMYRSTSQPRILRIRRHKMRKHKRRKRIDRDWFQYQKKHAKKKAKAEALFRARMREHIAEYERFDALEYVKIIMQKAKRDWRMDVTPTGRTKYPHWSTLMSLEELFGVEPNDHIDKRYGFTSKEEQPLMKALREKYLAHYCVDDPAELLHERQVQSLTLLQKSNSKRGPIRNIDEATVDGK